MGLLKITPTVESRIFSCPACKQTINTSAKQCPYCGAAIDAQAAELAADDMARVNQACSDASFLRTIAGTTVVFFGLSMIPFLGIAQWGVLVLVFIVLPVMLIRWWVKFGKIQSDDSDFRRARRDALLVGGGWFLLFVLVALFAWARSQV
jgi:hypothetical protein